MSNQKLTKNQILKENGTLNPRPETVSDPLFQEEAFFDARDMLQVKYEMLRRVQKDGWPVARSAETFGLSRPSFYKASTIFEQEGLVGFVPKKRGPKTSHKMSSEIMTFVSGVIDEDPEITPILLVQRIEKRFNLSVHPRTVERALMRREKKPLQTT